MEIRPESPNDYPHIQSIHLKSFPNATEADLVDRLRSDSYAVISLVAQEDDQLVGHVMFSRMSAPFRALGMAPVAVLPDWRRKGIAAALIRNGIEEARNEDWEGIFVLGDPDYHPRFGFSAGMAEGFSSPYAGPYLMVLALQGGSLPIQSGQIEYAPAFEGL